MAGCWYVPYRKYNKNDMIKWCKENATEDSWYVSKNLNMGVFEVCVGVETESQAFISHWFPTGKI